MLLIPRLKPGENERLDFAGGHLAFLESIEVIRPTYKLKNIGQEPNR
jgi:hypothetical protein